MNSASTDARPLSGSVPCLERAGKPCDSRAATGAARRRNRASWLRPSASCHPEAAARTPRRPWSVPVLPPPAGRSLPAAAVLSPGSGRRPRPARPARGRIEHLRGFSLRWRTMTVAGNEPVMVVGRRLKDERFTSRIPMCDSNRRKAAQEVDDEIGTTLLCALKLRTAGRQFDDQTPHQLQAEDRRPASHPFRRRLLRAVDRRGPGLLEAPVGPVSR